ncbi:MAG: isocitrate lyase/phosphoenolpyruvate mutase family protein [Planctomycetota bacterium]|nr:MAG: isocitrate lyase/phosphoenolpyruvate mutase family protein [Planctomycetota bacterium]
MPTQAEKAEAFRALHHRDTAFIIPNPWDLGTARVLEQLGFEALATTSAGLAFSLGKRDTQVGCVGVLHHARDMAASVEVPLSADLENGFGDAPEVVAETIRQSAQTGLVGGSIEDSTGRRDDPIYEESLAVDRIRAAVESARALAFPFTLTARSENYLVGRPDLAATIRRLQLYQDAGADVLYAPGLTSEDDIATLVRSVDRPVNVLAGLSGTSFTLASLSALGVRRISIGSGLYRAAFGPLLRAAKQMREQGTFATIADEPVTFREISGMY